VDFTILTVALKYHPDKPQGDAEKFKKINAAYETLKDDIKRAEYNSVNPLAGFKRSSASSGYPRANGARQADSTWSPRAQKSRRSTYTVS
jgi:curved DNA-binding protein CbpA